MEDEIINIGDILLTFPRTYRIWNTRKSETIATGTTHRPALQPSYAGEEPSSGLLSGLREASLLEMMAWPPRKDCNEN